MAVITETGIQNIVVAVLRPDPAQPIQMLVTCETFDADGQVIRRVSFPDWWDRLSAQDQAIIVGLYERFYGAAAIELKIDPPKAPSGP